MSDKVNSQTITNARKEWKVAGRTLYLRDLTHEDIAELTSWVQDQWLAPLKRNLDGLSELDRKFLLTELYTKAATIKATSPIGGQILCTEEGMLRTLWMHLRHDQPDMTLDELIDICVKDKSALLSGHNRIGDIRSSRPTYPPVKKKKARRPIPTKRVKTTTR